MAQESELTNLDNISGALFRPLLNSMFAAVLSSNAGPNPPDSATWQPHMPWWDTTNMLSKMRDPSNASWIVLGAWNGSQFVPYSNGLPIDAIATRKSNLAAGAAPTTGDDSADGYGIASIWAHAGALYGCASAATDAAQWLRWVTSLLHLSDFPSSYSGHAGKVATVNQAEDALEFLSAGIEYGTEQTITSGTTVTWNIAPATVRNGIITLTGVSTSSGSQVGIRLGTSTGIKTTGYSGVCKSEDGATQSTTSTHARLSLQLAGSQTMTSRIILSRASSTRWGVFAVSRNGNTGIRQTIYDIDLGAPITQAQLMIDGAGNFDGSGLGSAVFW